MKFLSNQTEARCLRCQTPGVVINNEGLCHCGVCGCPDLVNIHTGKEYLPVFENMTYKVNQYTPEVKDRRREERV